MASRILVDTNVLIDVATENPHWMEWSSKQLAKGIGKLAINLVVYGEFSFHYETIEEVELVLADLRLERLTVPYEAAFLAGKVFKRYRDRGGRRSAPLPDFFIGAHAAVEDLVLLTQDSCRYREYFPTLKMITPA